MVIIRTIGGVLDFYIIAEDSFSDVVKQYHSLIGTTFMPPYWAYGYQLSAWGYDRNGHFIGHLVGDFVGHFVLLFIGK